MSAITAKNIHILISIRTKAFCALFYT